MLDTRIELLRRRLNAHKRTLSMTHYGDVARLCLIEIAKDQAELDRLEKDGQDVLVFEDANDNDFDSRGALTPSSSTRVG
jgi:hypothetical protein